VPLQKSIGQARLEVVPSLIVLNARGATLQGQKLTLVGVAPNSPSVLPPLVRVVVLRSWSRVVPARGGVYLPGGFSGKQHCVNHVSGGELVIKMKQQDSKRGGTTI
jgi:hypothetical protein